MTEPEKRPRAFDPITPLGVAAFARASVGRLMLVQFLVALLVAVVVVWFLYGQWRPTILAAIEQMPDQGEILRGKLNWKGQSPQVLSEGTYIAFSVDLDHASDVISPAHVQVEFGRETFLIHSLFGYTEGWYPRKWVVAFNRQELKPWWGAWQPFLLGGVASAVVIGLMIVWYALATLYAVPVWLIGFFANRDLTLFEACRLAGAALMPGALLMTLGIVFYYFGVLDLVGLGFVMIGHLVLGWVYLFVSPLFLPKLAIPSRKNPFAIPERK